MNAFLSAHHEGTLPPEFTLLRFEPEPWTGPDVLVWAKMMAWDLSANYSYELLRHDLLARVGPERMADLLPPYPPGGLSILGGNQAPGVARDTYSTTVGGRAPILSASGLVRSSHDARPLQSDRRSEPGNSRSFDDSWSSAFAEGMANGHPAVRDLLLGGGRVEALGSNNWVVDDTLTASGKPLLANDPHLGTQVPSTWYLAHLSAGEFDVIGATLPGVPAVALGRNRFIAWGATNVAADVEDLYRERIDPTGRFAEFRGSQEPLRILSDTIGVRGGSPVQIEVRISRHGPLVSDAINANNAEANAQAGRAPIEPLALRWTALDEDDVTVAAFLRLNVAKNWNEFTAALRSFIVPAQNFVYADVEGHIGYYAPGRIPIRERGDGSSPATGWTGDMEWVGWIPYEALPHVYDPPDHFIVTANNRPGPLEYPHFIALEYPDPYRALRITNLIRAGSRFTTDDFSAIQADTLSLHATSLLPILLPCVSPETPADRWAVQLLERWNFNASGDSAAAAVFQAWFLKLAHALAGDELGSLVMESYQGRFSHVTRFVIGTLAAGESAWCDDTTTYNRRETCNEMIAAALHERVLELTRRLGNDRERWRWDAVHRATFPHQGFDTVPYLRPLMSRSVPSTGGDWSTVNVGTVAADRLFEQRAVPGYRQIVDLSPTNDSRFLDAVGQSGHFLSKHFDDFLPDWRAVRHRPMRMDRSEIERSAAGLLRLTDVRLP